MINILIADDNINLVELIFKEIVRKNKSFRLADYTYDGENAMKSILKYLPDVIILDLKMPQKDGISIIKRISDLENYNPYIIVISSFQQYINKVYKYKNVYTIINKGVGFDKIENDLNFALTQIDKDIEENKIYSKIKKEIDLFNFNNSNLGTRYLIDAIMQVYKQKNFNLTRYVYPILAKKYNVTQKKIKWNLEKNVKSMRRYTENKIIKEYFHVEKTENLTVKNVITEILENISKN